MELLIVAVVLLLLAGIAVWWVMQRRVTGPAVVAREERIDTIAGWPPQATRILTTTERLAYTTLTRALPGYMVLAQVPIARFTRVPMRNSYSEWLRRIGNHCADLVVCDMASQVIAVVHILPAAGESNERARRRHKRMARVLKAEGVALHTWVEGVFPTPDAARAAILPEPPQAEAPPTVPGSQAEAPAPAPARPRESRPTPFDDPTRDSTFDERIELRDAPPSTWYDDLETAAAPLDPLKRGKP